MMVFTSFTLIVLMELTLRYLV